MARDETLGIERENRPMSQNKTRAQELLARLEELVRQGKGNLVRTELKRLRRSEIPREFFYQFSEVARRIDEPLLALQIMKPIIRAEIELSIPPNNKEKVAYATALITIGAYEEALEILSEVNSKNEPETLLYRAFAYFGQWKYAEAIPYLIRFINSEKITDYRRLVVKVNLLACYISADNSELALNLARELLEVTHKNSHWLLHGNTRELLAQLYIFSGQFAKAQIELDAAEKALSESQGMYLVFVKKWQLIVELLTNKDETIDAKVAMVRKSALANRHWETLREIDLFVALVEGNFEKMNEVLFGTPFTGYRKRAEKILGREIKLSNEISRSWGRDPEMRFSLMDSKVEDLRTGKIINLRIPKSIFNFLTAISRDFYKPSSLGQVFSQVYPGEYFDPNYSPKKINNLVLRSRKIFKRHNLALRIEVLNQQYSLRISDKIDLRLRRISSLNHQKRADLSMLHGHFGVDSFSAQSAAKVLGLSKRTVHKLIEEEIKKSKIIKSGKGRSILYRFTNSKVAV